MGCGGSGPLYFDRPLQKGEVATSIQIGFGERGFFRSSAQNENANVGFWVGYGAGDGFEVYAGLPWAGIRSVAGSGKYGNPYWGAYLMPRSYSTNFGLALGLMDRPGPFRTDNALLIEIQDPDDKHRYWTKREHIPGTRSNSGYEADIYVADSTDPVPRGLLVRGKHSFGLNTSISPSVDVLYDMHPHGTTNFDLNTRFGR
jgi:hypothetical protein